MTKTDVVWALIVFLAATGSVRAGDSAATTQPIVEADQIRLPAPAMSFRRISPQQYGKGEPDFLLLETEVTNEMYRQFLLATGATKGDEKIVAHVDATWAKFLKSGTIESSTIDPIYRVDNRSLVWTGNQFPQGKPRHPVGLVSPAQAMAFCKWLTVRYGELGTFRLPSKSEWLVAAYGRDRKFPWGDEFDRDRFNCAYWVDEKSILDRDAAHKGDDKTSPRYTSEPVDARPDGRTPEGIYAMWGNVGELVLHDVRVKNYDVEGLGAKFMGGGFDEEFVKPGQDYWGYTHNDEYHDETTGFRVLLDVTDREHHFQFELPSGALIGASVYGPITTQPAHPPAE